MNELASIQNERHHLKITATIPVIILEKRMHLANQTVQESRKNLEAATKEVTQATQQAEAASTAAQKAGTTLKVDEGLLTEAESNEASTVQRIADAGVALRAAKLRLEQDRLTEAKF